LGGVHTISATATELTLILEVLNSSGDAYFSGPSAMPGQVALTGWVPCRTVYGTAVFQIKGPVATGTDLDRFQPSRPILVKDVQLEIKTAPLNQALIVDVNQWDGSAWQSMFSTRPQIAASANRGGAQPDATYKYRCFLGGFGSDNGAGVRLGWDVDQVGTGTTGSDLWIYIRGLQYCRPQEVLLVYGDT
jgi:hypothetical protein